MCLNIPPSWRLYRTGKPFMNPFPKEKKYHPNVKRLCNHGAEERKPVMGPCEECIDEGVSPEEARMSSKVMYRKGNAGGHRFQCRRGHWKIPAQLGPLDELLIQIEAERERQARLAAGNVQGADGDEDQGGVAVPVVPPMVADEEIESDSEMARRLALEEGSLEDQENAWAALPFGNVANRVDEDVQEQAHEHKSVAGTETDSEEEEKQEEQERLELEMEMQYGVMPKDIHEVTNHLDPYLLAVRIEPPGERTKFGFRDNDYIMMFFWPLSGMPPKTLRIKLRSLDKCCLADYPVLHAYGLKQGEVFRYWDPEDGTWHDVEDYKTPFVISKNGCVLLVRPSSVRFLVALGQILNAVEIERLGDGWAADAQPLRAVMHEKHIHTRQRVPENINVVCWGADDRAEFVYVVPKDRNVMLGSMYRLCEALGNTSDIECWDAKVAEWRVRRVNVAFHVDKQTHTLLVRARGVTELWYLGVQIEGLALPMTAPAVETPRKRARTVK